MNDMVSVYRSAAQPGQELRPLEAEQEMRLLLEGAPVPRRIRKWSRRLVFAFGATFLVLALVEPVMLANAVLFLAPGVIELVAHLKWRRRVARLRREGYDVDEVLRTLRVAEDPRAHVAPELREAAWGFELPTGAEARSVRAGATRC
jgi:hypothetical protein